ncbi:MAG: hypothetical protein ACXVZ2_04225, partial [Gaiellaceae bacterium]
ELAGPHGTGADQVWVLRPAGAIRDVVIFGHGWKTAPPSPPNAWVTQFQPWLDHLVQGGSAVIFPRYQLGTGDSYDVARVRAFRAGVTAGFAALGQPRVPVVAVGYSFGAALALTYAADARTDHLTVPRAVDAIFPAQIISGSRLPPLDPSTAVLIQIGDRDVTAGRAGGDEFWRWLRSHPAAEKRYELVRATPQLAIHSAPKLATPGARRAFWEPLDRLIALARRA